MIYVDNYFLACAGFRNFISTWKLRYSVNADEMRVANGGVSIEVVTNLNESFLRKNAIVIVDGINSPKQDFFEVRINKADFLIFASVREIKNISTGKIIGIIYKENKEYSYIIWNKENNTIILPFNPFTAIENYLYEKYLKNKSTHINLLLFYLCKVIPKKIKNYLARSSYIFLASNKSFPEWPIDDSLYEIYEFILQSITFLSKKEQLEFIRFWPEPYDAVLIISHDIDNSTSLKYLDKIRLIEKEYRLKSTYFFIADFNRYGKWKNKINGILRALQKEGFEIASHGLKHDGLLFKDKDIFLRSLKLSKEKFKNQNINVEGFRAEHLFRRADWMDEMEGCYSYDASFIDSSRLSLYARKSGCLSFLPFFINNVVEIPITIPLDYQLFIYSGLSIEKCRDILRNKIKYLKTKNGLMSFLIHPELAYKKEFFDLYKEVLEEVILEKKIWYATFSEVSNWWKRRDAIDFDHFNKTQIEIYKYDNGYFL